MIGAIAGDASSVAMFYHNPIYFFYKVTMSENIETKRCALFKQAMSGDLWDPEWRKAIFLPPMLAL